MTRTIFTVSLLCLMTLSASAVFEYSHEFAVESAYYAKAVRCSKESLEAWNCGESCDFHPNMKDVKVHQGSIIGTQAYTGYDEDKNLIVVSFRRTENWANTILDGDLLKIKYAECENCEIHEGFWVSYESLKIQCLESLKLLKLKHPRATILVTGHSLGAAMSSLAAIDIKNNIESEMIVLNFGCPRIGNEEFAAYFNSLFSDAFRVVHHKDVYPHTPPRRFNYQQYSREVWYYTESGEEYRICNQTGEDKFCSNSLTIDYNTIDHETYVGVHLVC